MSVRKNGVDDSRRVSQLLWEIRRLRRENASLVECARVRRLLEMTGVGWRHLIEEDRHWTHDQ